jgi:hypothetical protein
VDVKVGVQVKDGKKSAPASKGPAGNTTGNSTDSKTDYDYADQGKKRIFKGLKRYCLNKESLLILIWSTAFAEFLILLNFWKTKFKS